MPERDTGQDKTDRKEEARLVEEALCKQNQMPFYESEPPVKYSPCPKEE